MEVLGKSVPIASFNLEKFICEQNIAWYRRLLGETQDETRRLTIIRLLAEEVEKLART